MKNNEFNFLVEVLSKKYDERTKAVAASGYISESTLEEYRKDAERVVEDYVNGLYISNNGKRTNSDGAYINEKRELVNYEGKRINKDGELIDNDGEIKEDKRVHRRTFKNTVISFTQLKMDNYVSHNRIKLKFYDLFKKNFDLKNIDIDIYLRLALICHGWGMYKSHSAEKKEQSVCLKYLFDALELMNMWMGGCDVLMIHEKIEKRKENLTRAAQSGGKTRTGNYAPLKLKVVELLKEKMPEGGWKSKASAIDSLENDINKFMDDEQRKLDSVSKGRRLKYYAPWEQMRRRIYDWLRNDKVIKAAFDTVVTK